jgi:hypothetical protein
MSIQKFSIDRSGLRMALKNKKSMLPTAAETAQRLLILRAQIAHAVLNPPPAFLMERLRDSSEADRKKTMHEWDEKRNFQCAALRVSGLWDVMTEYEQQFISTPAYEQDQDRYIDAGWKVEAAACLMWSLGMIPELSPYDTEAEPKIVISVPNDRDHALHLINNAILRKVFDINDARDQAEVWHWRSRARELEEQGITPPKKSRFSSIDEMVRSTAAKQFEEGRIPQPIDGDFPAFGKAYRNLTAKEWTNIHTISMERHRAFNWLCGYAPKNRWDKTPIEI